MSLYGCIVLHSDACRMNIITRVSRSSLSPATNIVSRQGITYSVMSASWDEDEEGSLLGVEEFTSNLDSLKGGLSRSRENLITREKMAGMSEAEIQAALRDLEKREAPKTTISSEIQNLQEKE